MVVARLLVMALAVLFLFGVQAAPADAHDLGGSPANPADLAEARRLTELVRGRIAAGRPVLLADPLRRRQELLRAIAGVDPQSALDLALTAGEASQLPASVRNLAEEWRAVAGPLMITHLDRKNGTGEYQYHVQSGRTPERVFVTQAAAGKLKPGDSVLAYGIGLPGGGVIAANDISAMGTTGNTLKPTGEQKTAVILMDSYNAQYVETHPYADKTMTASLFFSATSKKSLAAYISEASYGQASVVGKKGTGTATDVYGPYQVYDTCDFYSIVANTLQSADPDMDIKSYDRIVIPYHNYYYCDWAGIASVGGFSWYVEGGTQLLSVSIDLTDYTGDRQLNGMVGYVPLHEYGHNLGLYHAYTVDCGTDPYDPVGCSEVEYGDPSDVMGQGAYAHYDSVNKSLLGWLGTSAIREAVPGTYSINALEGQAGGLKVLRVPRKIDSTGTGSQFYYLEYRRPTATFRAWTYLYPLFDSGVLIHVVAPELYGGQHSQLVDTTPGSLPGENPRFGSSDFDDAPLRVGQTFADTDARIKIEMISATAGRATVKISTLPPSLAASATTARANGTIGASWSGIYKPSASDYVGLFAAGGTKPISKLYVNCTETATAAVGEGSCSFFAPNVNGAYEFRLFTSDSSKTAAATSSSFTVTGGNSPTPTPTATRTPTVTRTSTVTRTPTVTRTATITPTRTVTATRTVTPTRTATATRTVTRTPTRTPTRTVTRTPTRTSTPHPFPPPGTATPGRSTAASSGASAVEALRVAWEPRQATVLLSPGQVGTLEATVRVSRALEMPRLRVDTHDGELQIDPSSLPARMEPDRTYTIRFFTRRAPKDLSQRTAQVWLLREDGRTALESLIVVLDSVR